MGVSAAFNVKFRQESSPCWVPQEEEGGDVGQRAGYHNGGRGGLSGRHQGETKVGQLVFIDTHEGDI